MVNPLFEEKRKLQQSYFERMTAYEELRHKNIMEELALMGVKHVTEFSRGDVKKSINLKQK